MFIIIIALPKGNRAIRVGGAINGKARGIESRMCVACDLSRRMNGVENPTNETIDRVCARNVFTVDADH